ncbi:MAG: NAD(P)/FAD-dependent oxidoreductase, partial [Desulfurococcales archaeon]|nr:NAD(P)/FAD-dependent oxidoreductase [Desulfurococcales archaeon]
MRAAVVGAGFAGLMWGLVLAEAGLEVSIYEEHNKVGYPPHCTGIVSERTVELIGAPARRTVESSYEKVLFEGDDWSLEVPISGAVRLDRVSLEELMLEELRSKGARIIMGSRVSCACPRGERVELKAQGGREGYDLVIIAEGYGGKLRERLGAGHRVLTSFGLNTDYLHSSRPPRGVILISFPPYPGSVFSWALRAQGYTVVGALSLEAANLARSVEWMAHRVGAEAPMRRYGGRVIHGPPLPPDLQARRAVIVGDAAGLNKPLTGGGLFPNALHARKAQGLMREGLKPGDAALIA